MSKIIKDIVIVGGGTAGWLTACNLAKQLNAKDKDSFNITLVESPDVPTIGVGEGSKALLIEGALGVKYIPFTDTILTNQAVFMQVPYQDENAPIIPCTVSTAQECGWTWDIGLTNRRGVGYVYSDTYCDANRAEQVLREYIGPQSELLTAKQVKVNVGQREKSFHGVRDGSRFY